MTFGPAVIYGLKTLNADERKIPLMWPVFNVLDFETLSASELAAREPHPEDTLAVSAVRQYDPSTLAAVGDA